MKNYPKELPWKKEEGRKLFGCFHLANTKLLNIVMSFTKKKKKM